MSAKTILDRVAQSMGRNSAPVAKPEIVRPQAISDTTPRAAEMKQSILADVNKIIVTNQSGKSGGV